MLEQPKRINVIQVLQGKGCVKKLFITVSYYCGSSHWKYSGKKVLFKDSCSEINQLKLAVTVLANNYKEACF